MSADRQGARPRAGSLLPLDYWRDPRRQRLGSIGRDLLTLTLSYSADNLTDGEIPGPALRMLASLTDDPEGATRRLIANGMLVVHDDGSGTIPIRRRNRVQSDGRPGGGDPRPEERSRPARRRDPGQEGQA